jgi:hypothetical protein
MFNFVVVFCSWNWKSKPPKPLPKPPKPLDWFPSLSPNWSYFNFLSVSDKTSYADDISLNFSSASLLSGFTSG